jgi:hypothetical protein
LRQIALRQPTPAAYEAENCAAENKTVQGKTLCNEKQFTFLLVHPMLAFLISFLCAPEPKIDESGNGTAAR